MTESCDNGHNDDGDGGEATGAGESDEAPAPGIDDWTCRKWLKEVNNLEGCLADALLADDEGTMVDFDQALGHVRTTAPVIRLLNCLWPPASEP